MTTMSRRALLGTSAIGAAVLLAGCTAAQINTAIQTIEATLPNAQAEASAIEKALQNLLAQTPVGSATITADLDAAFTSMETSVTSFLGSADVQSGISIAKTVVSDVQKVLPLLPLPAATLTAINLGLSLVSALANGIASITVPASAPASLIGAKAGVISAPIPIPLS